MNHSDLKVEHDEGVKRNFNIPCLRAVAGALARRPRRQTSSMLHVPFSMKLSAAH
jgi:hypothetical protein